MVRVASKYDVERLAMRRLQQIDTIRVRAHSSVTDSLRVRTRVTSLLVQLFKTVDVG